MVCFKCRKLQNIKIGFSEGANVSLSSLQATWPSKMDVEAAVPWTSLAECLT